MILLKKVILTDHVTDNETEITDAVRINVKKSTGNKGSGAEIILKNAYGEHIDNKQFKWKEQDTIQIFLKYTDDSGAEIDTSANDDLIMTAELEEYEANLDEKSTSWKLKCVDKTYILLNKLWAKAYLKSDTPIINGVEDTSKTGWTPPEIICNIINITTGKGDKSSHVSAKLTTNGGYIQNTRPDDSTFEDLRTELSIAKVFKPVYEWIADLSTVEKTNTSAEQSNVVGTASLVCKRPFLFYIDNLNKAHWEYPAHNNTTAYLITVGATAAIGSATVYDIDSDTDVTYVDTDYHVIYGGKIKKSIFDIINMVIFNAGDDFFGNGILNYFYDPTTKSPVLKPVYKPMINIAREWKSKEVLRGLEESPVDYVLDNDTGTLLRESRKYTATYPFKPEWADASAETNVTSNTELNDSLRTKGVDDGKTKASEITQHRANARWKGTLSMQGENFQIGNLVIFNDSLHGIVNAKVRITDVQHTVDAQGWWSTLTVEEDADIKTTT